ncbi:ATP-binding cassette domain-containing protein [Alkalihalobacillus sp. BA299]|uniref:branched-chain amino acid ABC transporter ATP-binding protein/permease n=1 Tax=Alkalihalobacillus sp. BA299 TaxID=2815938 RepID=UPI001ADA2140|nr:branched-chain amino acid ABC transporter ATP-binding protein/permease [Alkalihalobacillus sp. BA299]
MMEFITVYSPLFDTILITSLLALGMFCWLKAGLFSTASPGFAAIGAYTFALLNVKLNVPLLLAGFIAVIVVLIFAFVLGRLILRLNEIFYAMATLAFSELIRLLALNSEFTNGPRGVSGIGLGVETWQVLIAVIICTYFIGRVSATNGKVGRVMATIREDQLLANSVGIYLTKYKVMFFIFGAIPTALSGVLRAGLYNHISPENYSFALTLAAFSVVILGGREKTAGPLIGAIIFCSLPEIFRAAKEYTVLMQSSILLLMIIFLPNGVISLWQKGKLKALLGKFKSKKSKNDDLDDSMKETAATLNIDEVDEEIWQETFQYLLNDSQEDNATPLLEMKSISFSVGGLNILKGINLQVKHGECYGLIGPNGAGKTTTLNIINKFYLPTDGQIFWKGDDITKYRADQMAQIGIARTFQNIRLIPGLTVLDNVMIASYKHLNYSLVGLLLKNKKYKEQEEQSKKEALTLLRALGLEKYANEVATSLSYGIQRRVEVARALITKPTLLLLDEPTSGMNDAECDEFADFVLKLRQLNLTIIMIEHHIPVVSKTCDSVSVLNFGETIARGTPDEVKANPEVIKAYLGNDYESEE